MMKDRRILHIHWYESVRNDEVVRLSGLSSINDLISKRRHDLFAHVRRMDQAASAHQALHLCTRRARGSLPPRKDHLSLIHI